MGPVTQEDPIGIAGGLNLCGYADGDPINVSDPLGLNPCQQNPTACALSVRGAFMVNPLLGAAVGVALGGAMILSMSDSALATTYYI